MLLTWQTMDDATGKDAIAWATGPMHDIFMTLVPEMLGDAISFYGTDSYSETAAQAVPVAEADMARVDILCIPITAGVLYLLVRSFRLLVIPGLTLGVAAVITYAAMYVLGQFTPIMAVTPGLTSCLMISVSIDYAIFLLVRFREELPEPHRQFKADDSWDDAIDAAIGTTMSTSGATILLSGCVLFLAFLFMSFFPIAIVASMGMGACIAMVVMILVNLTLVPALLSEFRVFFTTGVTKKVKGAQAQSCTDQCWRRVATVVTTCPWNFFSLLVVVLLSLAVAYPLFDMQTSGDLRQIVGLGTRLAKVGERINDRFGGGITYPVEFLMVPVDSSTPILSSQFFNQSSGFIQALQKDIQEKVPEAADTSFNFLTFQTSTGKAVNFEELDDLCLLKKGWTQRKIVERALIRGWTWFENLQPMCRLFVNAMTNTYDYHTYKPTAAYGMIIPSIEPMGKLGQKFLDALRSAYLVEGPRYGIRAWFGGDAVKNLDMVSSLYGTFPKAILATVVTAALLLLITFRSIVMPIRCLLSNALTLGFAYGFTVIVYQYGALDFLGMSGVNGKFKSLPWCAPVIVFFIIFGIGLDYDIFLLVRITELRSKGKTPQEAVREGLVSTGGIITAAGLVMACAFSGILFSSMFQQAMFGFMITIAVLFDTFVARSVITPAGMSLLGYCNWWPSRLSRRDDGFYKSVSEEEDDDEDNERCW